MRLRISIPWFHQPHVSRRDRAMLSLRFLGDSIRMRRPPRGDWLTGDNVGYTSEYSSEMDYILRQ